MKNILKNLLGDRAYKQLLKLVGNGGGSNGNNNGGIKVLKVVYDDHDGDITSLWRSKDGNIVYTAVEFGADVTEDVKQNALKAIEANKTFANSVLEAINNEEPICINVLYTDGSANPYIEQHPVFVRYEYNGTNDVTTIDLKSINSDVSIAIPAIVSDDNTKYVLRDYVAEIGK